MQLRSALLLTLCAFAATAHEDADEEVDADAPEVKKDYSNGFGTDVEWVGWPEAIEIGRKEQKPVFFLIHKSWCGACKRLKESFLTSSKRREFVELSQKFVMVNVEDDDEPGDEKYAPDGRYIPRLYFLDQDGNPLDITNKNYPKNAYYFPVVPDVLKAMKQALKLYGSEDEKVEKPKKAAKRKADEEEKENVKKETAEKSADENEEKAEKKETKKEKSDKKKEKTGKESKNKPKEKKESEEKPKECPHAAKARAEKEKQAKKKADATETTKEKKQRKSEL